jgi:sugar lactone lactonase YvrE
MNASHLRTMVVLATAASMGCGGHLTDPSGAAGEPDATPAPPGDASAATLPETSVDVDAAAAMASDGSSNQGSGIARYDAGDIEIRAGSDAGDVATADASSCGDPACPGPCVDLDSDPHNCGACAHDCLGGACSAGTCQPVTLFAATDSSEEADWIAVDAANVYWTGYVAQAVMSAPILGGTPVLLTRADGNSHSIAINAQNVYWGDGTAGAVLAVPIGGGAARTIASAQAPYGVAADAASVYWTDQEAGTVLKAPANGGSAVTLASGLSGPAAIAIDATSAYFTTFGGSVMKVSLDGGSPVALASGLGQGTLPGIAVGAQEVYWTDAATGTVMEVPIGGGAPVTLASGQVSPGGIAADSSGVYWVTAGDGSAGFNGTVMKVGLDGGDPVTLVSGQPYPSGIALDAVSVYWADGDVLRLAK